MNSWEVWVGGEREASLRNMTLNRVGQLRHSRHLLTFLSQHGYEGTDKLVIVVGSPLVINLWERRHVGVSQLIFSEQLSLGQDRGTGSRGVTHLELLPFLHLLFETGLIVCNLGFYTL